MLDLELAFVEPGFKKHPPRNPSQDQNIRKAFEDFALAHEKPSFYPESWYSLPFALFFQDKVRGRGRGREKY